MISSILLIAICNVIAGRWKDLFGIPDEKDVTGGRQITLFFRCVIPAIVVWNMGDWYVGLSALIGYLVWATPGWSFDEITGQYSPDKYPAIIRKIGLYFVPISGTNDGYDERTNKNKLRGVIMKGLRGGYSLPAFILFAAVNPYALFWWLGTLSMGICYWIGGAFKPRYVVMVGELIYGALLAFLMIKGAGL